MKRSFLYSIFAAMLLTVLPSAAQQPEQTQLPAETEAETEKTAFTPIADTDPDRLWERANDAYISGDFAESAALYLKILDQGLFSAKLYYNLGNAYFRNGDNARAILYYNRALLLSPGDDDVKHNLAMAEGLTKDSIEEVPEFFLNEWMRTVRNSIDERVWALLSILSFATALALALLFLLARHTLLRKTGFYGTIAALVLFIAATSFAASQRKAMIAREGAIVMSTAAPVKSSPDRSATDIFVLHEGTKVRVVSTLDRWSEIVIADGKKGWIETDKIERI